MCPGKTKTIYNTSTNMCILPLKYYTFCQNITTTHELNKTYSCCTQTYTCSQNEPANNKKHKKTKINNTYTVYVQHTSVFAKQLNI